MASLYRKPIVVRDPKTGKKVEKQSKKWWGRFTDSIGREKRVPLSTDKRVWISEAANEKERKQREASDFLKYRDSQGRFADFHSLRHTFVTNLCKADISPKTAQTLARHGDIRLTMNIYTHVDEQEQADAIARLPGLDGKKGKWKAG